MSNNRELNQIEELLMQFLLTSKAQKGARAQVYLLLQKEDQQLEMCRFLSKNENATADEILEMAHKIAG